MYCSDPEADPSSKVRGVISVIFGSRLITGSQLYERLSILHNTVVTKQWTAKWPYIANAFPNYRLQNHGE